MVILQKLSVSSSQSQHWKLPSPLRLSLWDTAYNCLQAHACIRTQLFRIVKLNEYLPVRSLMIILRGSPERRMCLHEKAHAHNGSMFKGCALKPYSIERQQLFLKYSSDKCVYVLHFVLCIHVHQGRDSPWGWDVNTSFVPENLVKLSSNFIQVSTRLILQFYIGSVRNRMWYMRF